MRWLVLFLIILARPANSAEPFTHAAVDSAERIVPGQQVHVTVEVFAPDFFTSPPQFPLFEIPHALVTLSEERAQNIVQTVDGQQYSGIRRIYAVIPEKPGSFAVPPITIGFGWSRDGVATTGEVSTPPVSFEVAEGDGVAFAAKGLEISQSFDRKPSSLKVGDALVRTIIISARETQGIAMPAVDAGVAAGLRQYMKPAKIEDGVQFGRGETGTRRTEAIVYTADKQGTYSIPAISYPWFDIDSGGSAQATLPEFTITVASAAARTGIAINEQQGLTDPSNLRRKTTAIILLALSAVMAIWFVRRTAPRATTIFYACGEKLRGSRIWQLHRLRKTIRSAPPVAVYSALGEWARKQGCRTLREWSDRTHPRLATEIAQLEKTLFGGSVENFNRKVLVSLVATRPQQVKIRAGSLPPLNPL